ncbi:transglutaminase-like domain-containing protein [Komagataeibacter sp. FNDCR2]|uniref:transglutaminase-like domain-containing protein n=1 Tax=Komagataeibacter sp. FNDCR2 TaxID=2878682 RepID=UPI001E63945D|nr:transglutaminase-like domain-containing protein [Komagataeibacter sp. FNDCR2]MCE2574222.1 transglutaminase-like domain-containing protein [Komagataeibacter sp. FNDCR2]
MPTGPQFHDRYRTIDEPRILDALMLLGWAFFEPTDTIRATARQALGDWVKGGLGVRMTAQGTRLFDPVEVVYHLKNAGRMGQDGFWAAHYVTTSRRLVEDLRARPPGRLDVTLRRRFCLRGATQGRTLRLRMPLPLASRCSELDIHPLPASEGETCTLADGRLELQLRATDRAQAWLGARVGFVPRPVVMEDSPPDPALYLKPAEGLIRITDPVAALSRHLAGTQPPAGAVRAFWDFILDNFLAGPVHYDQIPANAPLDWVLASGCCDCHLASAFLVALCRARGIPARLVSGNFLYPRSPTMHYWAEIHMDERGWLPFDFMSWDLSRGGQDVNWRDYFYGRVDARLISQCLPRACTGPIGIPIPPGWRVLQTTEGRAVKIDLVDLDGHSLHTDYVTVETENRVEKETIRYMAKT